MKNCYPHIKTSVWEECMKKLAMSILAAMLAMSFCFADNSGFQGASGSGIDSSVARLDNMKLNQEVTIDGYATIKFTSAEEVDSINWYKKGSNYMDSESAGGWDNSGLDAQYYTIKADIINLAFVSKEFLKNCTVKAVYDDKYTFIGWCHQYNWNNTQHRWVDGERNKTAYINDGDRFPIGMMYAGHYVFGCTLPNAVMTSSKPLRMIITIDGNELIYNIRK